MEPVKMRTRTSYRVTDVTPIVTLNPEDFRNCTIPFEGDTEESFFSYITNIESYEWEDFIYENEDILPEETKNALWGMYVEHEWTTMFDSRTKSEEIITELGDENEEYRKYNGFEMRLSNDSEY